MFKEANLKLRWDGNSKWAFLPPWFNMRDSSVLLSVLRVVRTLVGSALFQSKHVWKFLKSFWLPLKLRCRLSLFRTIVWFKFGVSSAPFKLAAGWFWESLSGALGRKVTILVRRGARLSKIEDRTESYWPQSSVISWDGELYKTEERMSHRRLSGSMVRILRDVRVSLA